MHPLEQFEKSNLLTEDLDKITNILGYKYVNINHLGSGAFGHAFRINNRKVIKVTKDLAEVSVALKLKEYGWSKYIVTVHDVFKVKNYFIIIEDYINPIPISHRLYIDFIIYQLHNNYKNIYVDEFFKNDFNKLWYEIKNNFLLEFNGDIKLMNKFYDDIILIYKTAQKIGISTIDLQSNNLGISSLGNLVLFDPSFNLNFVNHPKVIEIQI